MGNTEKFENIVRSKFSERQIPYDESNWASIKKFNEQFHRDKKRRIIGLFAFLGLSCLILAGLFCNLFPHYHIAPPDRKLGGIKQITPSRTVNHKQQIDDIATPASYTKASLSSFSNATTIEKRISEASEKTHSSSVEMKTLSGGQSFIERNVDSGKAKKTPLVFPTTKSGSNTLGNNIHSQEAKDFSQYQGIKRSTVISNSTLMGNEAGPDATDKKVVQENDKKKLANSSFISAKSIDSIGSSLSGENENSPYNMVSNTESHDAMKNTSTPEEYGQNHQSLSNGTIPNSRSNDTIISKSIIGVSAEIGDTTKKQSGLNTNGKCMKISLEAGANALNNSVSPIIGVLALKPFSERWGGGIGLVYTYLKLPDNAGVRTFTTQSTCDFGYSANITEIRIDKLHYAIIPIFITANLNKTNSVQLGANVFFLFNSSGTISSYHEDYSGKQPSVSRKVNGYLNGFSAYDIGLSAGYRKQILCNIGAGAYLNYGLINIAKTEYYNAGAIGKNISMQLQLTYIIHK